MNYPLDTSSFSDIVHEHELCMARLTMAVESDEFIVCSIVRGEVLFGLARLPEGKRKTRLEGKTEFLFDYLRSEPVPVDAGNRYAEIKSSCRRRGVPLDENDLWIAATAFSLDAILVTRDSDYLKVKGLRIENSST